MSTHAGVGWSERGSSDLAAREAAGQAIEQCGGAPDLLLVYATSRHDAGQVSAALRECVGPQTRIVGGSAIGVLTGDKLGYDGYQVGVAALRWGEGVRAELFRAPDIAGRERECGDEIGAQIAARFPGNSNILLMYDSMDHRGAQPQMNMATPLLAGLRAHFPTDLPRLAGMGQCGDTPRDAVAQWFDGGVGDQSVQALVTAGDLRLDTVVMHGCRPAGSYRTVTKADGPTVLEIDHRPALEVVAELLGEENTRTAAEYRFFVTLGVNKGDLWGEFDPDLYANRLCCGVDEARGGLIMFEPDLVPGTRVQLMRRSVDFSYIEERAAQLLRDLDGRRAVFALYIDCAGRASAYCGSDGEEAAHVQRAMKGIPLLGAYCGVELARVGADWQPLDWSGVLCVWSESLGQQSR